MKSLPGDVGLSGEERELSNSPDQGWKRGVTLRIQIHPEDHSSQGVNLLPSPPPREFPQERAADIDVHSLLITDSNRPFCSEMSILLHKEAMLRAIPSLESSQGEQRTLGRTL